MDVCLLLAPVVALLTALFKRLPWVGAMVQRNPKVIAFLLSIVSAAAVHFPALTSGGVPWDVLAGCVFAPFAGAVAVHEVVLDPLAKAVGVPDAHA